jgi:hypothetical protein
MRLALTLLLVACTTTTSTTTPTCTLDTPVVSPTEAAPGDTVVLTTHPLTTPRDTVVTVGDARVDVTAVTRTDCDACDRCREDSACRACGPVCPSCVEACTTCVETVSVIVPDVGEGAAPVTVRNGLGVSAPATLFVLASGVADSGR